MVADAAPSSKLEENEQIIELNAEFVNGKLSREKLIEKLEKIVSIEYPDAQVSLNNTGDFESESDNESMEFEESEW